MGEGGLSKLETSNLPGKEFKVMVVNMLTKLRRMDKHKKNFNEVIEKK